MKKTSLLLLLPLLGFGIFSRSLSGENIGFGLNDQVKVKLKGSSNVNEWECVGEKLNLHSTVVLDGENFQKTLRQAWEGQLPLPLRVLAPDKDKPAPFVLQIPVESLNCGRRRMQRDLRDAVNFDEHPFIRYELLNIRKITPVDGEEESVRIALTGILHVGGGRREIAHEIEVARLDPKTFQVRGQLELMMTWFDMDPPKALLGLIKSRDLFVVDVAFQMRIVPEEKDVSKELSRRVTESD